MKRKKQYNPVTEMRLKTCPQKLYQVIMPLPLDPAAVSGYPLLYLLLTLNPK